MKRSSKAWREQREALEAWIAQNRVLME